MLLYRNANCLSNRWGSCCIFYIETESGIGLADSIENIDDTKQLTILSDRNCSGIKRGKNCMANLQLSHRLRNGDRSRISSLLPLSIIVSPQWPHRWRTELVALRSRAAPSHARHFQEASERFDDDESFAVTVETAVVCRAGFPGSSLNSPTHSLERLTGHGS